MLFYMFILHTSGGGGAFTMNNIHMSLPERLRMGQGESGQKTCDLQNMITIM